MRAWTFSRDQLQRALERFVEEGPTQMRQQRQEESDAALMVLDSDAFAKLRVDPAEPMHQPAKVAP